MKNKLIALVVLAAGLLAVGVIRTASKIQTRDIPIKDRLNWYVKEAQTEGRQKINIPAPTVEYLGGAGTISLDEASSSSTVVVAHLISKQSYAGSDDVITWNRFIIDEVLSEAKDLPCPACVPPDPPADLAPLQLGEFLLPKNGGTVNVEGIEIEQRDHNFPEFKQNQKYLLLINLYPSGVARTVGGPVGVFIIEQNDRVLPITESEHRIRKDLKEKYANSLDGFRKHLRNRNR